AFTVYPNPVTDFVGLKTHLEGDFDLQILDMQGKIVLNRKLFFQTRNTIRLDLKHLSSGQYVLRLSDDNQQFIQKIIKE
ncbi:MAG TPA: T9SS type A sorting domain-containing protein, partial [Bacteroidales bacterium]|nr:T9SS type A sorting domain-containing protein [Bacteroidales bacterium]